MDLRGGRDGADAAQGPCRKRADMSGTADGARLGDEASPLGLSSQFLHPEADKICVHVHPDLLHIAPFSGLLNTC